MRGESVGRGLNRSAARNGREAGVRASIGAPSGLGDKPISTEREARQREERDGDFGTDGKNPHKTSPFLWLIVMESIHDWWEEGGIYLNLRIPTTMRYSFFGGKHLLALYKHHLRVEITKK